MFYLRLVYKSSISFHNFESRWVTSPFFEQKNILEIVEKVLRSWDADIQPSDSIKKRILTYAKLLPWINNYYKKVKHQTICFRISFVLQFNL